MDRFDTVPTLKELKCGPDDCEDRLVVKGTLAAPKELEAAVMPFIKYAALRGFEISLAAPGNADTGIRVIPDTEGSLPAGGYTISAADEHIVVTAADLSGLNHAFATLIRVMRYAPECALGYVVIPACEIQDWPDCEYRGLMVDLARFWHPFEYLLAYVDLCWYYKLSCLHLHFTDDQSYTLPSNLFPQLSTPGRTYSFEELNRLNEYARARGVELIPELEVPGHNASFARGYPELFGTNGIICQHKDSIEAVCKLFSELCELFPYSKRIHLGGDEANLKNWLSCPRCMEYARSIGLDPDVLDGDELCERLYVNFINTVADVIRSHGRQPVVWEGFPKRMNDYVPKDILVMSWENYYQVTPDLLSGGYRIVNSSWNPMYIVAPDVKWPAEELYEWSIFRWKPVHPGSPYAGGSYECPETDRVIGGQLQAWGDRIPLLMADNINKGAAIEYKLIGERLPYLAQNTWNIKRELVYNDMADCVDRARMASYEILTPRFNLAGLEL